MDQSVVELFAGPGGLSEGGRLIGLNHMYGFETGMWEVATAEAAGHKRTRTDVRALDPLDFKGFTGLAGGPPCTTWTVTGKQSAWKTGDAEITMAAMEAMAAGDFGPYERLRSGLFDNRTGLVAEMLRFALLMPDVEWVVAEQVPKVRPVYELIARILRDRGWGFAEVVELEAMDYSAGARRRRVFLIANRLGPTGISPIPSVPLPETWMSHALGWPEGLTVNTRGVRETSGGNEFSADQPAWCVTGNGVRGWIRTDLGRPDKEDKARGDLKGWLSVGDVALLQGLGRDYPFQGSRSPQLNQAALVVCPLVGAAVLGSAAGIEWEAPVRRRISEIYGHVHGTL